MPSLYRNSCYKAISVCAYPGRRAANPKGPAAMTSSLAPVSAFARPMRTAAQREERRIRILGMLRAGHSYEAIARQERLSRERVRQIVAKSLETEKGATLPVEEGENLEIRESASPAWLNL
jgi:hypothetical protein